MEKKNCRTIPHKKILESARSWVGTRFRYHGRIKINDRNKGGVDCLGLVLGVADEVGAEYKGRPLSFYDDLSYPKIPKNNQLKSAMDKYFLPINSKDTKSGSIALFQINKDIQHLGILSDVGLIHCYLQARRVVEHEISDDFKRKVLVCYDLPKAIELC